MENMAEKVEKLTLELTNILGVTGTSEESKVAEFIYNKFKSMDYFKEHPGLIRLIGIEGDNLNRKNLVAIIKGEKRKNNKTLILMGHLDTVGISDYGDLSDYATNPAELEEKLKNVVLPEEASKDLYSGEYLFGRGIFDMKCGTAGIITIMEDICQHIKDFEGNIVFLSESDEEGNSVGMISAVPYLIKLRDEEGFEYMGVINADINTCLYPNDERKYIFTGTAGKLMPTFYIVGKEAHVGEPFSGLDPNLIASQITCDIDLNCEYCDEKEGELTLPPITLKQKDLKEEYSVQTARTAYLYFNYLTNNTTPDEVLMKMKKAAENSFKKVIDKEEKNVETYFQMTGFPYKKTSWKERVMTYEELYRTVKTERGKEVDDLINNLTKEYIKNPTTDKFTFSLNIVKKLHEMWSDRNPIIIIYFSPIYYPHNYIKEDSINNKKFTDSIRKAIDQNKGKYDVRIRKFFPWISDLSYVSAPKEESMINAFKNNTPGYGSLYSLPLKEMQQLNLPAVNIGPFGKDAHKFTERLHKDYSFNVFPKILYSTIKNLLS